MVMKKVTEKAMEKVMALAQRMVMTLAQRMVTTLAQTADLKEPTPEMRRSSTSTFLMRIWVPHFLTCMMLTKMAT